MNIYGKIGDGKIGVFYMMRNAVQTRKPINILHMFDTVLL